MNQRAPDAAPRLNIAAHVVIQLGQELVTDVEQAFLELAKNAYDADAEFCRIRIEPEWKPPQDAGEEYGLLKVGSSKEQVSAGRVLVIDDGVGATPDGVNSGWLTISASLKRAPKGSSKPKTGKGRTPVGDKGLGRLATMKIGNLLIFRTSQQGERNERITAFSWKQFESVSTLAEVEVKQYTRSRKPPFDSASTIEIVGLHEAQRFANDARLKTLVARMSSLVNPYAPFADFEIEFEANNKAHSLQRLTHEVLNFAVVKFEFVWTGTELQRKAKIAKPLFRGATGEDAKAKYESVFGSEETTAGLLKKFHAGRRLKGLGVQTTKPPKGWIVTCEDTDHERFAATAKTKKCGAFRGEIYFFLFNDEFKQRIQGNAVSAEMIQKMAGVRVFRDGFRVRIDDDWMKIAEGMTSGAFTDLRSNNTLGYFALTNEHNPDLIEKSDREGFVENEAWHAFFDISQACKKYANEVLAAVREDYNEYVKSLTLGTPEIATPRKARAKMTASRTEAKKEVARAKYVTTKAADVVDQMRKTIASEGNQDSQSQLADLERVSRSLQAIEDSIEKVKTRVDEIDHASEVVDSFREEESSRNMRLIDAAAVGLTARALAHELNTYLGLFENAVRGVVQENKRLKSNEIAGCVDELNRTIRELKKVISALDPMLPGARAIREKLSLMNVVREFADAREDFANAKDIELEVQGDTKMAFRFSRTRFYQIMENLFQNSVYWIEGRRGHTDYQREKIVIRLQDSGFEWSDSGPGVSTKYEETLFDPFVSAKPGREGQGLGLYIVTTYLESERCSISLSTKRNAVGNRFKFDIDLSGAQLS